MFPTVGDDDPCPCGSAQTYGGCCAPAHRGRPAATPEALMRSRYSAFVVGDAAYLRETWHPGTRPDDLDLDADTQWTGLEIVETAGGGAGERRGWVEFRAHWRSPGPRGGAGTLHERSRFVRQSERWWYLDGEVGIEPGV